MSKQAQAKRAARLEEAKREAEAAQRRRARTMMAGVAGVLALIVLLGFLVVRSMDDSKDVSAAPAGEGDHGVAIGDPDAPHQVVIYEDFLCPFCGDLEAASRDDLAELAEAGKVYVEYRPFDLLSRISDYPIRATAAFAVVLEESGPEVAKEFHDLLFENQPSEEGPFPEDGELVDLAVEAGADRDAVAAGIEDLAGKDWVDEATRAASEAGVQGTPTVLVDGEVVQEGSMEDLADRIVELVG
ncbi:thioredoxin domain-containing protein [Nocardioides sp. SYSU D00038]|uniref:DsbA family protein n=1 Tax=Nocardioides sp. SYSU D00038 TaxID=2812554 RepID=UPI001966DEC8|nr:thioredoxin domain-containing protein [Nocardioides sp. SYSU D00038]